MHIQRIKMPGAEADRLAEVLRNRPVKDRPHSLARRVAELIGERGR